MVKDLASVIEDWARVRCREYNLFQGFAFKNGALDELIEVIHIALQMLAVVETDCVGADYRLQCVFREWEQKKFKHVKVGLDHHQLFLPSCE